MISPDGMGYYSLFVSRRIASVTTNRVNRKITAPTTLTRNVIWIIETVTAGGMSANLVVRVRPKNQSFTVFRRNMKWSFTKNNSSLFIVDSSWLFYQ